MFFVPLQCHSLFPYPLNSNPVTSTKFLLDSLSISSIPLLYPLLPTLHHPHFIPCPILLTPTPISLTPPQPCLIHFPIPINSISALLPYCKFQPFCSDPSGPFSQLTQLPLPQMPPTETCITGQIIAYGFVFHPGAFCRSSFNLLDLVVVGVSLASFIVQ